MPSVSPALTFRLTPREPSTDPLEPIAKPLAHGEYSSGRLLEIGDCRRAFVARTPGARTAAEPNRRRIALADRVPAAGQRWARRTRPESPMIEAVGPKKYFPVRSGFAIGSSDRRGRSTA